MGRPPILAGGSADAHLRARAHCCQARDSCGASVSTIIRDGSPARGHTVAYDHQHHEHSHSAAAADFGRIFAIGVALNLGYVVVEAGIGVASGSLALIADAGHNLGDVLGLFLSWGAAVLSRRRPGGRFTYGYRASSILAALANAVILLVVTGGVAWEALWRLWHPVPVAGATIAWVAAIGILVNGGTALLFASGRRND